MPKVCVSSKGFVGEISETPAGTLVVDKFRVDFERKQFIKISNFSWNVKVKVEILTAASVQEPFTGQVVPIAVVKSRSTESSLTCYVVSIDLKNEQFIPLRKFKVDSTYIHSKEENHGSKDARVFILNGQCVTVFYRSKIFIYCASQAVVFEEFSFDINCLKESFVGCCKQSEASVKYQNLLETWTFHDKYILFLLLKVKIKCVIHGSEIKSILRIVQFSGKQFSVLKTRQFIPDEFVECVTSICMKSWEYVESHIFNCDLYLGTSEGYIVHIKNGNLIQCSCLSEYYSVSSIRIGITVKTDDETGILAGTEDSWSELTNDLQVKKKHSGIRQIFMGDFFQNGSLQFLLLNGDVAEGSPWILTDLKTQCLSSEEDNPVTQNRSSKSSSTAVKALKSRLQREQILLHDEEVQLHRQADFISDMFAKQVSVAAGASWKPRSHQPKMINLIMGVEDEKQCHRRKLESESSPAIWVRGHWQRTYGDSWCVGVDVTCCSARRTKVWLDVDLEETFTRTVNMTSSCLVFTGDHTGSHPKEGQRMNAGTSGVGNEPVNMIPFKRQKLSDRTPGLKQFRELSDRESSAVVEGTVVCVLPVPHFGVVDSVTANLILNWTHPVSKIEDNDFENVVTPHEGQGDKREEEEVTIERVYTLCCGKVTLKTKDVLDAKYELDFRVESGTVDQTMPDFKDLRDNQQAWRHIQTVHHLVVKGSPGVLARFESLLTDTCGFVYNQHYDCYVTMVMALSRVQVQLAQHTSDDYRQLSVYTSQDKDLLLIIHHLYAHLPGQVVIIPRENSPADILQKCLPALQKEADFLSHELRKLFCDHEAENASVDSDDGEDGDMRKVGEKFKRRRERMQKTKNDIMSNEKVKQFIEKYKTIQDQTDVAIITAANTE